MGTFIKGDIVVIPFPFSNLSGSKRRPALVLTDLNGDDILLCQITSKANDTNAISITKQDFTLGSLPIDSYVRPLRIFTADKNIIIRKAGVINKRKFNNVIDIIINNIKHI
ncbi:MAG: type II toxin-antitoxin system PemK/MazF family toxin [Chitinophagales bacterium]|nr:type II toxin-antitoxin system PemK/MazF family toxin [Chitinophagales bacterium]